LARAEMLAPESERIGARQCAAEQERVVAHHADFTDFTALIIDLAADKMVLEDVGVGEQPTTQNHNIDAALTVAVVRSPRPVGAPLPARRPGATREPLAPACTTGEGTPRCF